MTTTRPTAATVEVSSARFERVTITPGVLDETAEWVYSTGQSLAFAVAVSQHTGWPVHLRLLADPDDACDNGCAPASTRPCCTALRHAYVQTPDRTLLDIEGVHDPDVVDKECRSLDGDLYLPPRIVPAIEAVHLLPEYAPYLPDQDLRVARKFVKVALDRALG